jgi:hypothetical protein
MATQELDVETREAATASALYVYGIVPADTVRKVKARGVGGSAVHAVVHRDLAALVSEVETPVRAKRRELLGHTEVLNEAVAAGTVLPVSFGTTFPDEGTLVSELLEPRREELKRLLEQLENRVELTLRAFYRPDVVLGEIVRSNPRIARLREATRGRPEAATHAARLELGTAVAAELEARARGDAAAILNELRPLAVDVRVDETPIEHQVVRASLLVARWDVPAVDAAMDDLARRHAGRIDFKYVGPLAPHSFVSLSPAGR